jgi:hypothetical protein
VVPACPARIDPVEGKIDSHAPPEAVVADAAQFSVSWPPFDSTNVWVVAVEPVAASVKVT